MLSIDQPALQYEDVALVRKDGIYDKIKPDLHVDRIHDLVKNETINVEVANAYGAWWFCCIPVTAIRRHGLPLPLFIRCDDVEYGMSYSGILYFGVIISILHNNNHNSNHLKLICS